MFARNHTSYEVAESNLAENTRTNFKMSETDGLSLKGSQILPKPRSKNLKSDSRANLTGKLRPNSATHDRKKLLGKCSDTSIRPKSADTVLFYREKQKQRLKEESREKCIEKPIYVSQPVNLRQSKIKSRREANDFEESSRLEKLNIACNSSESVKKTSSSINYASRYNLSKKSGDHLNGIRVSSYLQNLKESVWTSIIEDEDKHNCNNSEDKDEYTVDFNSKSEEKDHVIEEHEKNRLDNVILQFLSEDNDEIQFGSLLTGFTKEEETSLITAQVSNVEKTMETLLAELENEVKFQSSVQNDSDQGSENITETSLLLQEQSELISQEDKETKLEETSSSQKYDKSFKDCDHPTQDSKIEVPNEIKAYDVLNHPQVQPIAEDILLPSPTTEVNKVLKDSEGTMQGVAEVLSLEKGNFEYHTIDVNTNQGSIEGRPTSCIGKSPETWAEFDEREPDDRKGHDLYDSSSKSLLERVSSYMEEECEMTQEKSLENEATVPDRENLRKYETKNEYSEENSEQNIKNNIKNVDLEGQYLSDDDSMYEDVVSALKILEKEAKESVILSSRPPPTGSESGNTPRVKITDILSYLETVEETCETAPEMVSCDIKLKETKSDHMEHISKESEEDTSNKTATSNDILEMRLQEQAKGLSIMKKELKETRKRLQKEKEDIRKSLTEENEKVVKRHQEFIQKLLAEKQAIADKCESLTITLKKTEENHKRNLKAVEEQHAIALRNERERIRLEQRATREKWMREKTQKIQAVTAKGAEGEVKRLVSEQVHQIEALWRARLDELRGRLERESEEGMARERENARKRLEERVEELERFHQEERRKFLSEECVLRGRAEEAERKVREIEEEARRRRADDLEAERMRFQAKIEKLTEEMDNRYQISLSKERAQREMALETARKEERELMEADYRKQEARMKERFRAERDQAIEKAVAHLTAQTEKTQLEAEGRAEMSLRRMRERCDEQVKMAEEEAEKQRKVSADLRSQTAVLQEEVAVLKITVTRLEKELESAHKMNNTLYEERSQIRDLVVEEWSARVAALREEVGVLKAQINAEKDRKAIEFVQLQKERELELVQIQKRVEITVAKKEEAYNQLKAKYEGALVKCSQLQELLEKQRMDLLLK